jgi:hypothetical protein
MDWLRASWYYFSIGIGYADTYRNEQYLSRTDYWYNYERKMHAINFRNPDTCQISSNLLVALDFEITAL